MRLGPIASSRQERAPASSTDHALRSPGSTQSVLRSGLFDYSAKMTVAPRATAPFASADHPVDEYNSAQHSPIIHAWFAAAFLGKTVAADSSAHRPAEKGFLIPISLRHPN